MTPYDIKFHEDLGRALQDVYTRLKLGEYDATHGTRISVELHHLNYLEEAGIIKSTGRLNNSEFIQFTPKGIEVFEKYGGWNSYKKKVIDRKIKLEKSRELKDRLWWIPIVISIIALAMSIYTFFTRSK